MKLNMEEYAGGLVLYAGKYPRVTDILGVVDKPYFKEWRTKPENQKKLESAKVRGTKIHYIAERLAMSHASGTPVEIHDPEYVPYARGVREFLNEYVEEVIATEQKLVSHEHGFGGTTDLIATVTEKHGGGLAIFDLKAVTKLQTDYKLQTAAYRIAAWENGYPVERRFAVWIKTEAGKEGDIFVREHKDEASVIMPGVGPVTDEVGFLGMLRAFYWLRASAIAKAQRIAAEKAA